MPVSTSTRRNEPGTRRPVFGELITYLSGLEAADAHPLSTGLLVTLVPLSFSEVT